MSYWQERALEAMQKEKELDIKLEKELERIINNAMFDIEQAIYAFYAKYADKEGLTIDETKKKLDKFDVQAFKDKAKQLVKARDFSKEANEKLREYNTKMYISREELLKAQLLFLSTVATAESENLIYDNIVQNIDSYLKHQSGILGESLQITQEALEAIVNMRYFGANWSDKLWKNQQVLQKEVEKMVSNMLLRGRHPNEFIKNIRAKYTERSTYEIKRLALTEATRARTETQLLYFKKMFGEDGYVEYQAKLDERTSDICRSLDGNKIKVKDIKPGINAPPMHPFCRSILVESVDENWREKFFKDKKGKYTLGE